MNSKELQSLDEALDYLNDESVESLLEFSVKDTLDSIIDRIKKAIVKLIDKAKEALSKCKDSKLKTTIKGILDKAKKLLTKSDNITTEKQANEISEEVKELNDTLKNPYVSDSIIKYCNNDEPNNVITALGTYAYICDKDSFLDFKAGFEYANSHFDYDWCLPFSEDSAKDKKYYESLSLKQLAKEVLNDFNDENVHIFLAKGKKEFHIL